MRAKQLSSQLEASRGPYSERSTAHHRLGDEVHLTW